MYLYLRSIRGGVLCFAFFVVFFVFQINRSLLQKGQNHPKMTTSKCRHQAANFTTTQQREHNNNNNTNNN